MSVAAPISLVKCAALDLNELLGERLKPDQVVPINISGSTCNIIFIIIISRIR